MWRLLLGRMGVKSLVQGLNAAAMAGFEPRTVWSEVRHRNRLATAPPFWRFVFLWVIFVLLNPIESFSWRGCVVQATKNKEESCSFLDAILCRSCGPLSGLAKNRPVGKPKLRLERIETAGRYATVRFVTLLWLALQLTSRSSLLCMHIVGHATESEVHASGKFCSISDPSPPPLSLSPFDQMRAKESLLLNTTIRTSKRKFAKCGHQVQVSRAHTASM